MLAMGLSISQQIRFHRREISLYGLDENCCRNPDMGTGAWCCTTEKTRFEYCDIPVCPENIVLLTSSATAWQSSISSGFSNSADSRAIDGATSGVWDIGSVTQDVAARCVGYAILYGTGSYSICLDSDNEGKLYIDGALIVGPIMIKAVYATVEYAEAEIGVKRVEVEYPVEGRVDTTRRH
jgi:hypothetical protein